MVGESMNFLLIGMPGCGNTTFGKNAARRLGLEFVDVDREIVNRENRSINQIFADEGEDYFRAVESRVLADCLKRDRTVISAGGGIVEIYSNIENAKAAGAYIIFIDRPLAMITGDIDTSGRPLLKDGVDKLKAIYDRRRDLYFSAADAVVKNDKGYSSVQADLIGCIEYGMEPDTAEA